jgi:hypothetical protein
MVIDEQDPERRAFLALLGEIIPSIPVTDPEGDGGRTGPVIGPNDRPRRDERPGSATCRTGTFTRWIRQALFC